MIILEEKFKWHLEAFASELFICRSRPGHIYSLSCMKKMAYFKTNICTLEAEKARTFPSHCNQAVTASV